jgi:hypothetical protein
MYQTILLPFVLYGYGTWSVLLRGEHRLRVWEIFGPRRDEVTGSGWEKCAVICVPCPTLLGRSSNRGCDGQDMWHVGKEEKCMQALGRET